MNEGITESVSEKILQLCSQFGVEVIDGHTDLTSMSAENVRDFFKSIVGSGEVLLHGTNSAEVYECLETRQGHCIVKESGRKMAVYATTSVVVPIARAVLNRKYLDTKSTTYIWGNNGNDQSMVFNVTSDIYPLFRVHDPNLFSDGYVYVLDKANFINAADAGSEWHSESDQIPLLACKVSVDLAKGIFINGEPRYIVKEYDKEEIKRIEDKNTNQKANH